MEIEDTPTSASSGWSLRLPVRAEHVTLSRQVVVCERVVVTRRRIEEVARVQAELRREELRTSTTDQAQITQMIPTIKPASKSIPA
jgi:uncharacterized protein (TIGR02271 family)